mgnify:CR=1 FL=1
MKLKPINDRIIVKKIDAATLSKGGIYVPGVKSEYERGEIVAAGPGRMDSEGNKRIQMYLKTGDKVLFSKHLGRQVYDEQIEVYIMHESDVLATIEE